MKNLTKKSASILALLCIAISSFAIDIYLSPDGDDGNDGSSTELAVATLTRAIELIPSLGTDYVIKVSGFIHTASETVVNKKIYFTIEGDTEIPSGFDGGNTIRAFNFQGASGKATLKNLTFRNGRASEGGGVRIINSGEFVFENCTFSDNNTTGNSGTLHLYNVADVKVNKCTFTGNKAKFGGAIYQNNGAKVSVDSCLIENNDNTTISGSAGGAVYMLNPNGFILQNSIIRNNKSLAQGGAIAIYGSSFDNKTVSIQNTLIANNESTNNAGGGIYINNEDASKSIEVVIANSTIYKNRTLSYGGAMYVVCRSATESSSSLKMVNSTVVENSTQGNGGHCGGLNVRNADGVGFHLFIYNNVWEDNVAENGGNPQYRDIGYSGGTGGVTQATHETDLFVSNSYIGTLYGVAGSVPANNQTGYGITKAAGLARPYADYIASQNSIPLDFDSDALEFGDAQYLQALGINTDQLGNHRSFTNGKCAAGAVETPAPFVVTNPDPHDYHHFIIYGQSLSVGYQAYQSLSLTNIPGNYMLGNQVWLNYGNTNIDQLKPLVSTSAITSAAIAECPVTAAVNHIRLQQEIDFPALENRFIATSVGMGGKTVVELSKGNASNLYNTYSSALKAAYGTAIRSGSTIDCPAIVWMQGEDDYTRAEAPAKAQYKSDLIQLKNDMQNDVATRYGQSDKPFFYTYQVGAQYTRGRELNVGMAQLEASNQNDDLFCVGPVYPVTDVGGHIDANGSRWYGEMIGKVYYKTRILGEDFKPLQPKKLSRDASDAKKVIIQFLVPKMPIVLDINTLKEVRDYGFEVYNNNSRQTISNITVANDSVIITCAANLTGKIEVVYAGLNTTNADGVGNGRGHGNLRDSDDAKGFFNYIDPNLKENGEYVYPHYDNLSSYTPANGEPKDENGEVIYDQPYPLYNFSVAFYYAIPEGENSYEVPELNRPTLSIQSTKTENISIFLAGSVLTVDTGSTNNAQISLFDISGKKMKLFDNFSVSKKYNLSDLTSGVYIVKVQTVHAAKSQKIVL